MKRYTLEYCSGATCYGWKKSYDNLDEFEDFVDEMRHEYTAYLNVWDEDLNEFIFYKRTLCSTPEIDNLHSERH